MSKVKKTYMHVAIGIILGILILMFLKPENGLEPMGVKVLAAFVATMYWWITLGMSWTVLIGVPLLTLTGAMSYKAVIQSGLGNPMVFFLLVTGLMNVAILETGVAERLVQWFITRKIVKGRPYMFIFLYMLSIYIISLVMAGATVCIIMLGMIKGICEELKLEKEDKLSKVLYLLVNWVSLLGFIATPIGHSTAILAIGLIETFLGVTVTFGQWCALGIPISLLWFGLIFLTVRFIFKIDMTKYENYDIEGRRKALEEQGPLSKRGKITVAVFLTCVVCFFLPDILKGVLPGVASAISSFGIGSIMTIGVATLCVVNIDGKPILDWKTAIKQNEWTPILSGVTNYAIAAVFGVAETGITLWITNLCEPLTASITSWLPFVLLVSAAALFITQLMSCGTTETIIINVSIPLALALGNVNPIAIAMVITYVANIGLMTPPASGGASVTLSTDYLTPKDGLTMGWWCLPQGLIIALISYIVIDKAIPFIG